MSNNKEHNSSRYLPNRLSHLSHRLGPIEYRSLAALTAYAGNPRKHPEKQIVRLVASIEEFGFALPVLIDADAVIVAGEARVEAAKRLNLSEVPVIVADHWSKAQVRAYRLADNRLGELSEWDEQSLAIEIAAIIELDETPIELMGWETAEIDLILAGDNETAQSDPADEVPEPPRTPVSQMGDLWLLDKHRLLCGSSLEEESWARVLAGQTAAMAFSDPPYNVPISGHVSGLGKHRHAEFAMASGEMSKAQFTEFLTTAVSLMAAPLKEGAILDLCIDHRHIGEMLAAIEGSGLAPINLCVWRKANGGMGSLYRSQHELVFIVKKGSAPHTNNVQLGKFGRNRTNVWECAGANGFSKSRMDDLAAHPTIKPVTLVAEAILDVTHPGEIVLDGFMGSGTTILAAERTKRVGYGIEIDPGYVDIAIRRWETMTGRQAVHAESGKIFSEMAAERAAVAEAQYDRFENPAA